jgi:uncharacterized membrane protein YgcG
MRRLALCSVCLISLTLAAPMIVGVSPSFAQSQADKASALGGKISTALAALPTGSTAAQNLAAIEAATKGSAPALVEAALAGVDKKVLSPAAKVALGRAMQVAALELKIARAIAALGPNPTEKQVADAISDATKGAPAGIVALALDNLSALPGATKNVQLALNSAASDAREALADNSATGGTRGRRGGDGDGEGGDGGRGGGDDHGGNGGGGSTGGGGGSGYGGPH